MDCLPLRHDTSPWPPGFEPQEARAVEIELDQWISSVPRCSSEYGNDGMWTKECIVGPPRVTVYDDNPNAWAPANPRTVEEWVELEIEKPCQVRRVRIHESFNPGALARISLWDGERYVVVHEQEARCGRYPHSMRIEDIEIAPERQLTASRIKLDLDQSGGFSWYEIDAVQVSGKAPQDDNAKEPLSELALALSSLLSDTKTADSTLIVSDWSRAPDDSAKQPTDKFPVHRGILAARSPVFRAMIDRNEIPMGGEAHLNDIAPKLIKLVLEWIYTGRIAELDSRDCVNLFVVADYFQVDSLVEYCLDIFRRILTVDNAALLYSYYGSIGVTALQEAALDFCGRHFLAVSQTPAFKDLSQFQLLSIIERFNKVDSSDEKA